MRKIVFIALLSIASAVASENVEIDWSTVKPLTEYPEFREIHGLKPLSSNGNYQQIEQNVANGNVAGRHDFPFKSALISHFTFGNGLCGSSIISHNSVLTAAHCVHNSLRSTIILGASDLANPTESFQVRFEVPTSNYRIHPNYRVGIFNSDIAIVRFTHPIHRFHQAVNKVFLPTDTMATELFANLESTAMGFGRFSQTSNFAYRLQFIDVVTMANLGCAIRFPGSIDTSHICTSGIGGRGICEGDLGGPLIIERNGLQWQIGIASLFPDSGCATTSPSVYTRITSFLPWIRQNM